MSRPLSFVRLDIARFGIEISDRPDDKTLADWVRKFHRSLALQDDSLCEFGAKLLHECAEFRAYDAKRKKFPKESKGIQRNHTESTTDQIRSDQIRSEQNKTNKEEAPEVSGSVPTLVNQKKKKEFADDSNEMKAAKYFWAHVKTWAPSTKEPSQASFQKWAKDFDAIMRIDGRTKDEIKDLLACINDQKESPKGFSWRKNILSPATLRDRWNEGKLDGLKQEPEKERSIYDIIPNLRMPKESGEYA